ncbi:MAG TPA: GH32 C-terminal domain-containing protein [Pirellulaceae bacterium]|jgi:hypothetical protein|nr:GH32 C-terminal domain-containing protein [Pirellulaceae bacterium]
MKRFLLLAICLSFSLSAPAMLSPGNVADDILVNDFEGEDYGDWTLPANEEIVLKNVHGNAMELVAEIDPKRASMIELNVLRSENAEEVTRITFLRERGYRDRARRTGQQGVISIDNSRSSILPDARSRPPETAQIVMGRNEPLKLRVFIGNRSR